MTSPRVPGGEVAIVVAGAVPAFLLTVRFRMLPILVLLGLTSLSTDRDMLATGFPSIGLNAVDLTVLFMAAWVGTDLLAPRVAVRVSHDRVFRLLLVLFGVGWLFFLVGLEEGAAVRTAFRDLRLFIYTPVVYAYVRSLRGERRLATLVLAWVAFVAAGLVAVGMDWVQLRPDPATPVHLIASAPAASAWHFLGIPSFVPMLVALAYVTNERRRRGIGTLVAVVVVLLSIGVAVLSLNRTLWLALPVAIVVQSVAAGTVAGSKLWKAIGLVAVVALLGAAATYTVRPSLLGAVSQRLGNATAPSTDPAVSSRLDDTRVTLGRVGRNPIGHGLGVGDLKQEQIIIGGDYAIGSAQHNGFVWLAFTSGLFGAGLFVTILVFGGRRASRLIRTAALAPFDEACAVGLLGGLVGFAAAALFGTAMLNFMSVPYWGLFLGGLAMVTLEVRATGSEARRA